MPNAAPHIFLSYARADGQTAADTLRTHLADPAVTASAPLAVWQDLTSMHSGQWREQIRDAIKNGNHLLLVLSPEALKSEVCSWEWHVARLEGAEISPVLIDPVYDLAALPKWMTAQHIYRIDLATPGLAEHPEWQRLVASLRAAPTSRRMPIISRTPGERYVPRPTETDALRDMLLDARGDAVGITTAFTGSGGMGKTTLALALAHDQRIQSAFYGGQLLVELGQQPNLLLVLRAALHDLTGENSDAETVKQATEKLAAALADRRVLLVIDDVWNWLHLEPFMQGGPNCARLVTTRDEGVLAKFRGAMKPITVDQMSEDQAVALLGAGLGAADIAAHRAFLVSLANRLGRCALLLELANGRIWTWAHDRGGLGGAVDEAEIEFRFKGVTAFDTSDRAPVDFSNPTTRNEAYADSIAASLGLLTDEHKARFLELAIFPEDTDIPYASIALYWAETAGMDERATFNLLDRHKRMSLVKGAMVKEVDPATKVETPGPAIRLHDVIRSYARDPARTKPEVLAELNRQFWKVHVEAGERSFAEGTALAQYAYERLPWHLREAGESEVLDALLLQPAWLKGKLQATSGSLSLVADYEQYAQGNLQRLIGRTLRLTTGICTRNPRDVLSQLVGRLIPSSDVESRAFVDRARSLITPPALVPRNPSLTPPGSEITRFDTSSVTSMAVLLDGRLAWGSADNSIRLWDMRTGSETACLEGHISPVTALAVLPDGRLASGSQDKTVRLWDVRSGAESACLLGHTEAVNALAVLPDGRVASGSVDNTIRLWDLRTCTETARLEGKTGSVMALAVLPDGRLAAAGAQLLPRDFIGAEQNYDVAIQLWDVKSGVEPVRLTLHLGGFNCVLAVLLDGRLALGRSQRPHSMLGINTCRTELWDVGAGAMTARLDGHAQSLVSLAVLPDGSLASGSADNSIRLWDVRSGAETTSLDGHSGSVTALAVLPDGRLASGSADQSIRLWDPKSSSKATRDRGHSGPVRALAVLRDGRLASGSGRGDNTIRLWDVTSGAETGRLEGESEILALAALPDGRIATSDSYLWTVWVWDPSNGAKTSLRHTGKARALAVLPDGRLATGLACGPQPYDGTSAWTPGDMEGDAKIRLWDPKAGAETSSSHYDLSGQGFPPAANCDSHCG